MIGAILVTIRNRRDSSPPAPAVQRFAAESEDDFAEQMIGRVGWRRIRTVTFPPSRVVDLDVDVSLDDAGDP